MSANPNCRIPAKATQHRRGHQYAKPRSAQHRGHLAVLTVTHTHTLSVQQAVRDCCTLCGERARGVLPRSESQQYHGAQHPSCSSPTTNLSHMAVVTCAHTQTHAGTHIHRPQLQQLHGWLPSAQHRQPLPAARSALLGQMPSSRPLLLLLLAGSHASSHCCRQGPCNAGLCCCLRHKGLQQSSQLGWRPTGALHRWVMPADHPLQCQQLQHSSQARPVCGIQRRQYC